MAVCHYPGVFDVGDVIRKLRLQQKKNTTLKKLAKAAGISVTTLTELERGLGNQRRDKFEKVAQALGTTVTRLYVLAAQGDAADVEPSTDRPVVTAALSEIAKQFATMNEDQIDYTVKWVRFMNGERSEDPASALDDGDEKAARRPPGA